ncbi:sensor histidine kinase KdpD [Paenibacillus sp. NEAU-GSW1]|uniref:sensor histidine kinase n=1 Tax=Paenibacillus sp. NEAU-GSW1 TaxID=2682486 RepID=UPI0012E2B460|nr:HAMP domain-containing sensor histidine kinase [Paenibacillus sp. NEAU-GSW1]MUT65229.1 sensor histidine kinase [Paenibacillus sp. NEAU-GSW1]
MWYVVFTGAAAILFAALYLHLRRSMRLAARHISGLLSEPHTNRRIHFQTPDKQLEALLIEVNRIIAARQEDRIAYGRKEQELRREISSMTHDLRTPLTSILGYIELIKEEQVTAEETKRYLDIVERRSNALRSLINGLYDLSRIEARDYPIQLKQVDLQLLLKRAMADFYPEMKDAAFDVVLNLSEGAVPVIADEEIVMRIYMNVLQNVLKHGCRSLHLFQGEKDGSIVTVISNVAASFREEALPHLFERSYTSDPARTGNHSGLGLAVVKGLMEQMGYRVHAEYEAPIFTICLNWTKGEEKD